MDGHQSDRIVRNLAESLGAFSRRTLLKGAAATALLPTGGSRRAVICPPPEVDACEDPVDVVVVGAGLAGLTAARVLVLARRSVVVLEAQPKVGGRMVRKQVGPDAWVDLGGQWIGPTQYRIRDLATQLGVTWWDWEKEVVKKGKSRFVYRGKTYTFKGSFPPFDEEDDDPPGVPEAEVDDAKRAWQTIDKRAEQMGWEMPPWTVPGAEMLDSVTVSEWLRMRGSAPFARFTIENLTRIGGSGAFEPDEVSMLHLLFTQAASPQREGPETELFHGGAGQIPEILADQLEDRIKLGVPVERIDQTDREVKLYTPGRCYRARYAIVAIPPSQTLKIAFDPPLPDGRRALVERMPMGKLSKVHVVYPTPFWREWQEQDSAPKIRLNGIAITDLPTTPFTVDSSPPSGSKGILTTFVAGNAYDRIKPEQRQDEVLADLKRCFGEQAADRTLIEQYIEKDWPKEERIGGAFTAYLEPGAWTSYGPALREPFGRIYWAGTETATRWPGYFDGAVQSGEEAAAAVRVRLSVPEPPCQACTWTGTWNSDLLGQVEMAMSPDGAGASGAYTDFDGTGPGTFMGQASSNWAAGWWKADNRSVYGWYEFQMADDCQSFTGSWQGDPAAPAPYTNKEYRVNGRR